MKRWLIVAVLVFLGAGLTLRAEEPAEKQLEFVRKLRDKGYADLALEYLEKVKKSGNPALATFLPLEMARTRIALSRDKEPEQRLALLNAARADLETFVSANPKGPDGAQARLELARLVSQQGKALLSKALRREDTKSQQEEARKAEAQFERAGKELEAAAQTLAALAASFTDPDPKKEKLVRQQLDQERLQARFDRGLNLMDQVETYIDLNDEVLNRRRAEVVQEAKKIFEEVAKEDASNPTCIMAVAWLIRCAQEGQDPTNAARYYKIVLSQPGRGAEPAKRLARYFNMQGILKDPTVKAKDQKKYQLIQKLALSWLTDYKSQQNSAIGQGVRFELADAYIKEAQFLSKNPKSATVAALYEKAQKILAALAQTDGDFSEKANQLNLTLSFMRMGTDTPIKKLKDFDECFLRGHYELFQLKKLNVKDPDKQEKEARKRLRVVIEAFMRALSLADGKTSAAKVGEARFFVALAFKESGDLHRAAVAGEALARLQPTQKFAPTAAGYAIQAYAELLARDQGGGNRERLLELATYILQDQQKLWQADPVTPVARYHLGMLYGREGSFKEAVGLLEQLSPDYSGFTYAQGQLVFLALEARNKSTDDGEKKFFQAKALAALDRIPRLPANADPTTTAMFFFARMEKAKWLYSEATQEAIKNDLTKAAAKYKEMAAFNQDLQAQYNKLPFKLSKDTAEKLTFTMKVLEKYNRLGLADLEYRAGNYDKVLAPGLAGAAVEEVKKLGQQAGPIRMKDFKVAGDLLGLALRSYVQIGKIDDARAALKLLERLTGVEGEVRADPTEVLRALVQELEIQVRALQKANDTAKLKVTVTNFSAFVDELAKNPGKTALKPADYFFLARCYDSIAQHCKAAELYGKVAMPKFLDRVANKNDKKPLFTEEEEKEVQTYWYSQVQYAKQLRQCPENKKANLDLADRALNRLLSHANARGHLLAEKEKLYLLEERGLFGRAITAWGKFMANPSLKKPDDPSAKETYYDAYYHYVYCTFKYSQGKGVKGTTKEKAALRRAADYMLRMENIKNAANPAESGEGWQILGPRFRELMEAEPSLRVQYEDLKKKAK
jgi:hypothetical protein